ncbi:MAG: LysR family transcriptional regulator [Myxococcales bacterium]|nr:LysR family transcriptional regulator [Myxococcales bacterium]MCB9579486.1 LysR family transcriptional regulator [Polyangiaceae bacterium]
MLDWNDLRTFLAVHRSGTLARAATTLGINATTVGRRLAVLEEELGAKLFDRTPDGYSVTQAGLDLLPRAERMEQEAIALERELAGADQRVAGTVRVSVTETIGTRFIAPHLHRFAREYPELTLDLSCNSRSVSLARREADIALRLARPRESDVVTRRLSTVRSALYAARCYLQARGTPRDPERDLSGHDAILFADSRPFALENGWFSQRLGGARVVLRCDSVSSIFSATTFGLGIALLPQSVAAHETSLVRLATETEPEPRVIWQAVHRDLAGSARIRAVLDFLHGIIDGGVS